MAGTLTRDGGAAHSKLLEDLLRRIESGELKEDDCLLPEMELSRVYDLSRKSVRKALGLLEGRGLLRRVPGRGTFVRPRPKTGTIACVFRAFQSGASDDNYFFEIFSAISQEVSRKRFKLLPCTLHGEHDVLADVLQADDLRGVLVDERIGDADLARIKNLDVPVALLYRTSAGKPVSYVMPDNVGGAQRLTQYLISLGHERIGFICDELSSCNRDNFLERLDGYLAAHKELGVPTDRRLVRMVTERNVEAGYAAEAERLLGSKHPPTAIFAANDRVAPYVLQGIRRAGCRMPEDVSLVGFADKEIARQMVPPLTTVKVFTGEMGRAAVGILFDAIEGRNAEPQQVRTRTELVIRQSCMPPRAGASGQKQTGEPTHG